MSERESRLNGYRHRRDHFFAEHAHSPLTAEQRERFQGLDYFPERTELSMNLPVDVTGPDIGEEIELPTTDGKSKRFAREGRIKFEVDGTSVTLTVLRDLDRGGLFVPFRDALAGSDTYDVGRYLEPQLRPDGSLDIDFNYAYNPFCAYGEGWSCPLPPDENVVELAIRAGERMFRLPDDTQ